MSQRILMHHNDRVLTITNNDPDTLNSISSEFCAEFFSVMDAAATDDDIRAIVLTGADGFFCSGGNLDELHAHIDAPIETCREGVDKVHAAIKVMRSCPKPIVAALEGGAAGAGVPLALAADMIVAARSSYMSIAYVFVGLTPDGGTTAMLSRMLPRHLLSEMAMTGTRIEAQRLHELGVVNTLCESGKALAKAQEQALRLSKGPPRAIAKCKELIYRAESTTFEAQLDAEAEGIINALGGPEAREGLAAFIQKRRPDWR